MRHLSRLLAIVVIFFSSVTLLLAQCNTECGSECNRKRGHSKQQVAVSQTSSDDEFAPYEDGASSDDEFMEYGDSATVESDPADCISQEEVVATSITQHKLFFPILSLIATAIAGILVRFKVGRKFRGVFLVLSVITLGFYVGACPCPISSFSYTIMAIFHGQVIWENMIWFLALIPLTYFFHKTWCGWICHLGALQELIFIKSSKFNFLEGPTAQKIMKYLRYIFTLALIIQVAVTNSYLFNKVDPFKTAYNLGYNAGYLEWTLLGLLLLTSIFIYRPFCKSACPIGLILGLVTKIKGAAVLGSNDDCVGCSIGSQTCNYKAINKKGSSVSAELDNKQCIACGECMNACRKSAIQFYRNNKEHVDVAQMCKKS